MSQQQQNVRFVRINGRVVPIRRSKTNNPKHDGNNAVTGAAVGVAAAGALAAADAARTRRVYERGGVTIDRKKFSIQPFVRDSLGDRLIMRKDGKKVGTASWYANRGGIDGKDVGSFSWLTIKKSFRKQGHADTLSRVAAHEMKRSGLEGIWNQVVHPGSALTNSGRGDSFWKIGKSKGADVSFTKVTKGQALANIYFHRKTKGLLTSDIFRYTTLKGKKTVMPGIRKAYMTKGTKKTLIAGIAVAAAGMAAALWNEGLINE